MSSLPIALIIFVILCYAQGVISQCSPTWQENQVNHTPTDLINDIETIHFLTDTLEDESDFNQHLETILIPRNANSTNHTIVENYIAQTLSNLGWSIEIDSFEGTTPNGNMTFSNIIADFNPNSPRRLVIACHYETMPTKPGFVGAIDSAVPCSMMLNLAFTLNDLLREQNQINPELTLTLIFFDGEEAIKSWTNQDSLYGSKHLSERWSSSSYQVGDSFCQTESATFFDRMDVFLLLDLIGTTEPSFERFYRLVGNGTGAHPYYDMMHDIEAALLSNFPISTSPMFNGYNSSSMPTDDHTPFYQKGFRRIFYVITRPFPPVWHQLTDNRDCLDFDYIKTFNKLLRIWTMQFLQYTGLSNK